MNAPYKRSKKVEKSKGANKQMYVCRKMKLCSYLLTKGFHYKETRQDRYNPLRKVWLFESSPELYVAIDEYYSLVKS